MTLLTIALNFTNYMVYNQFMTVPDRASLRRKLQRMGMAFSGQPDHVPQAARPPQSGGQSGATLPGGQVLPTDFGPAYAIDTRYPYHHQHGPYRLGDLLARSGAVAATLLRAAKPDNLDLRELVFLDTETTGLGGGAGTLAFVIGVGWYEDDEFVLRQYFLRDPAEETAVLSQLAALLNSASGLVTFNGRSFDVPLLETRYLMNRLDAELDIRGLPNLDLLHPARRLWRGRLESCSLGSLETHILGLDRTDQDVPGWMIPMLYNHYIRSGETHDMERVLYHNREDILSMVSLAAHLLTYFGDPLADTLSGEDCLRLARWYEDSNRPTDAEVAYRQALARELPAGQYVLALRHYARYLKRANRRSDACAYWEALVPLDPSDSEAAVELAKYFEWHAIDLSVALYWTDAAIDGIQQHPIAWRRHEALADLHHRRDRLHRKHARRVADG